MSMRGEMIDFNRLTVTNGATPALGNANKNARGDLIDSTGTVLRTQEQITEEYARRKAAAAMAKSNMDIKADLAPGMIPQTKQSLVDDAAFDPAAAATEPASLLAAAEPPKLRNRKMADSE